MQGSSRIKYHLKLCWFQQQKTDFKNFNRTGVLNRIKQVFQLKPADGVPEYEDPLLANRRRTGSRFVPVHLRRCASDKIPGTWEHSRRLVHVSTKNGTSTHQFMIFWGDLGASQGWFAQRFHAIKEYKGWAFGGPSMNPKKWVFMLKTLKSCSTWDLWNYKHLLHVC